MLPARPAGTLTTAVGHCWSTFESLEISARYAALRAGVLDGDGDSGVGGRGTIG
jgi:hypothetical protein